MSKDIAAPSSPAHGLPGGCASSAPLVNRAQGGCVVGGSGVRRKGFDLSHEDTRPRSIL